MIFCPETDQSILTVPLTTCEGEIDYESGILSSILPPLPALHIQVQENESNNRDSTPQTWNAISFDEEYEDTLATETINMRDMDAEDLVSSILRIMFQVNAGQSLNSVLSDPGLGLGVTSTTRVYVLFSLHEL